ncbi:hypothetical protein SAMN05444267_100382 [Chryseobacterium polytrichastri]|uniref:Uncharacterized protein n=1 Tax=Chryseobacterium polytrichastri TaxID=1302687 RepID=A0A1M6RUB6_9FLAO|nr:hypothetical protein SAMN05444267_100382 [Chryseobacterium polytrichastri]
MELDYYFKVPSNKLETFIKKSQYFSTLILQNDKY